MNLLLTREYWPGGTNGSLDYKGDILCATTELPAACFMPSIPCLAEGIYELHSISGCLEPLIGLFGIPTNGKRYRGVEACIGIKQLHRNIVLVSEITGEGIGTPCGDALKTLASLIGQASNKGERAYLEIRSYPEVALNLAYHQIRWMD